MPVPIICLDEYLRQFAQRFRDELSKPQYQHFVIVLLGLMLCEGARTLSGWLRQIADGPNLAGLSRFLAQAVCAAEGLLFHSKIDPMEAVTRTFEPVAGTLTHVLLDSWYSAKRLWRAARERGFLITNGLKSNRWLLVKDPTAPQGWRWQRLSDYTATLSASDYVQLKWPKGDEDVYVHVVTTRVRKLYSCQVVIVRSLDAPVSQARYWASSDLEATPAMLLDHIAARWDIEVLFGNGKEELSLDQYQLMSSTAIVRFWTLAMLAYVFLEEEHDRLQSQWQCSVTIGEARREIQRRHRRHLLDWPHGQFQSGIEPISLYELFSA